MEEKAFTIRLVRRWSPVEKKLHSDEFWNVFKINATLALCFSYHQGASASRTYLHTCMTGTEQFKKKNISKLNLQSCKILYYFVFNVLCTLYKNIQRVTTVLEVVFWFTDARRLGSVTTVDKKNNLLLDDCFPYP